MSECLLGTYNESQNKQDMVLHLQAWSDLQEWNIPLEKSPYYPDKVDIWNPMSILHHRDG